MSKQKIGKDMELIIETTLKAREEQSKASLFQVWEAIKQAAAQGDFECYIHDDIVLNQETIDALKEEGFRVKRVYPEIDDWGNYYKGWVRISWKKNINPFRKIIYKMFGV